MMNHRHRRQAFSRFLPDEPTKHLAERDGAKGFRSVPPPAALPREKPMTICLARRVQDIVLSRCHHTVGRDTSPMAARDRPLELGRASRAGGGATRGERGWRAWRALAFSGEPVTAGRGRPPTGLNPTVQRAAPLSSSPESLTHTNLTTLASNQDARHSRVHCPPPGRHPLPVRSVARSGLQQA